MNLPILQVWTSMLSLFLLLTVMSNAIVNTVNIIVRTHTFLSLGALRCWNILFLSSKTYFSCLPEMQSCDFPIPLLTLLLLVFLMIVSPVRMQCYLTVVRFAFLSWQEWYRTPFPSLYWSFVYLLWRNTYTDSLPAFKLGCIFFKIVVYVSLYITRSMLLIRYRICKYFPSFCVLSLSFLNGVLYRTKTLILGRSCLFFSSW